MTFTLPFRGHLGLALTLAVAPLALSGNAPATRLRFAPAEGSSVTRTFEKKSTLSLEQQVIEGMTGPSVPDVEMTMVMNQHIVVTDEFARMREGSPARLVRTFDELEGEISATQTTELLGQRNEREQNMRSKSALLGKKVAFTWDAEHGRYDKAFVPEEKENDLLGALDEDMDLRVLLPAGEVAVGDAWDVDLASFHRVLAPGGDVALVPEATDDRSIRTRGDAQSLEQSLGKDLEGHVRATLAGTREVDGVTLARVTIEVNVHSDVDMTAAARKAQESSDGPAGVEIDSVRAEYSLEGKGELLWDLAANRFRSFELSGQTSIKSTVSTRVEVNGKMRDLKQTNVLAGTSNFTANAR